MPKLKLHRFALSGHSHRGELLLSLLGLQYELVDVALARGEHKQAPFLALNPFGQVPVLEDGDSVIADSNAILVYLAEKYDPEHRFYPADALGRARVQRWLSVAAGQLFAGPCAARMVKVFNAPFDHAAAVKKSDELFTLLEAELTPRDFLVGDHATIADVALYTYTAHAPEGGISLAQYPAIRAWIARIEALPGFVAMPKSKELA